MKKKLSKKKIIAIIVAAALVVTIAVLAGLYWYVPGYYFSKNSYDISQKAITDEITVMSYNIRYDAAEDKFDKDWKRRAPLVVQVISEVQPDVIGFQEVQTIHETYLKKHLKGYSFYNAYRTDDENKEGLMIAYRSDRFESVEEGCFWLSKTPEVMSKDEDMDNNRITLYVKFVEKGTDKSFAMMDTHLDNASEEVRERGIGIMLDQKQKLGIDTLILVGDMNDDRESPMYAKATESGLVDARSVASVVYDGPGSTFQKYGLRLYRTPIDFCFLTPEIKVNDYAVFDKTFNGVYPSDHFPVVVKISL